MKDLNRANDNFTGSERSSVNARKRCVPVESRATASRDRTWTRLGPLASTFTAGVRAETGHQCRDSVSLST